MRRGRTHHYWSNDIEQTYHLSRPSEVTLKNTSRERRAEPLVTFDGKWHHLDRVGINPLPVQRPIPVWMGSSAQGASETVLKRVGRVADGWFPHYANATPEHVAAARGLGLKVGAWTVNDPADMRRLIELDAICTDRPDILHALQA